MAYLKTEDRCSQYSSHASSKRSSWLRFCKRGSKSERRDPQWSVQLEESLPRIIPNAIRLRRAYSGLCSCGCAEQTRAGSRLVARCCWFLDSSEDPGYRIDRSGPGRRVQSDGVGHCTDRATPTGLPASQPGCRFLGRPRPPMYCSPTSNQSTSILRYILPTGGNRQESQS